MKIKKIKIAFCIMVCILYCSFFNVVQAVINQNIVEGFNISLSQAGQYVAEFMINFYNSYKDETVYTNTNSFRDNIYSGNKTKNGITIKGDTFNECYAMDSFSMVSFAYHKALGLGGSEFEYFVQASENKLTVSKYLEIVLGDNASNEILTDKEITENIEPGDILFSDASRKHLAIYAGAQKIIHLTSTGLTYEDLSNYSHGFVAAARLKSTYLPKITYATTKLIGKGNLTGVSLNGGVSISIAEQKNPTVNENNNNNNSSNNNTSNNNTDKVENSGAATNNGTSAIPNEAQDEYNSYRLVDVNDKLPLYKHILLTEKYNFNMVSWLQFGHGYYGTSVNMQADKNLGLRYPLDNNNTSLETFVSLVQPYLQTWYIPLATASQSLIKKDVSKDEGNNLSTDDSVTTRDAYFPYTVIRKAYSDIVVNKYDLQTLTLRTSYDEYDLYKYHSEFEITITEPNPDANVLPGHDVLQPFSISTVQINGNVQEVQEGNPVHVNTRMDKNGNVNYKLENYISENKTINTSYHVAQAKTFDLKFIYNYNYQMYSDTDVSNRVNEKSNSDIAEPLEENIDMHNKLDVEQKTYNFTSLQEFLNQFNASVVRQVSKEVTGNGAITKTVYRLRRNSSYSKKVGQKHYVTRTWSDELDYVGSSVNYYTVNDLIEFNTSRRSGLYGSQEGASDDIDLRAQKGNLPYITDRKELIDMYAKRNGINVVENYSKPSFEEIRQNRQNIINSGEIKSEYKLINFRYIADAILDAQKRFGVNALIIAAASEAESNTGADPSNHYTLAGESWDWISMERVNSMYYDMKDSESLNEGNTGNFLPNNGHDWIVYTDPSYCVYDFAHYIKHKYLNNDKYNIKYCAQFCDAAWTQTVTNIAFDYCDSGGYNVTPLSESNGKVKKATKNDKKEMGDVEDDTNGKEQEDKEEDKDSSEIGKTTNSTDMTAVEFMKIVGQLCAKYEASFNPGVIGGTGNKAFGKYQYHADFVLPDYVTYAYNKDPYTFSEFAPYINGKKPLATDDFRNVWIHTYNNDPQAFEDMQDMYAYEKIYKAVLVPAFSSITGGKDLDSSSDALKAAVFSIAIRGGTNAESISKYFVGYKSGESELDTINRIYDIANQKWGYEGDRFVREKEDCIIIYNGGSITSSAGISIANSAFGKGLKASKNDYNTYKYLELKKELNRIDFFNANSSIYSDYLREDEEVSEYMGYSSERLRSNYYNEITRLIRNLTIKFGELPFVYFASLGFKVQDIGPNEIITSNSNSNGFGWPVDLTNNEGARQINCIFPSTPAYFNTSHGAIDIAPGEGENNIIAAKGGTVISVTKGFGRGGLGNRDGGGYGNNVVIDHGDGYFTRYSHLSSVDSSISVGVTVKKGQKLGVMGSSGNSTGTHLDFTVYQGSTNARERIDPLEFYNTEPSYGSIVPSTITGLPSGYSFKSEKLGGGAIENVDYSTIDRYMFSNTTYEGYPVYSQDDYASTPYNGSSNVAKDGCGVTTMAMILAGNGVTIPGYDTNGDGVMTPDEVARFATAVGADGGSPGVGTYQDTLYRKLQQVLGKNKSGKWIFEYDGVHYDDASELYSFLSNGLSNGYTCGAVSVKGAPFSSGMHIIAIVGKGSNGLKTINSSLYCLRGDVLKPHDKAREFTLSEFQRGNLNKATLFKFNLD